MSGQNDWWLHPIPKASDITTPLTAETAKVLALLGEKDSKALLATVIGRLEGLYQHVHNRAKVAPSMAAGVTITADAAAWTFGAKSGAIIEDKVAISILTITNECTTDGDVTITIDGVDYAVTLATTDDTAAKVATEIETELNKVTAITEEWTLSRSDAVITFTADNEGEKVDIKYAVGDTGATGEVIQKEQGIGGYPFDIHWINFEALSENTVYELVLYADDVEVGRARAVRTDNQDRSETKFIETPIIPAGSTITGRLASAASSADTATISLGYHVYNFAGAEFEVSVGD